MEVRCSLTLSEGLRAIGGDLLYALAEKFEMPPEIEMGEWPSRSRAILEELKEYNDFLAKVKAGD